jgi:signal transduction histidine kinase
VHLKHIFYLVLLLSGGQLIAQPFTYYHYTTREGLISNTVQSICADDNGFLWIGTAEGVCKYDGSKFEQLKSQTQNGKNLTNISVHRIVRLTKDKLLLDETNYGCFTINCKTQQIEVPKDSVISGGHYISTSERLPWHFFFKGKNIIVCDSNLNVKRTFSLEAPIMHGNVIRISNNVYWLFQFLVTNAENVITEIDIENCTSKKIELFHPKSNRLIRYVSTTFKKGDKVFVAEFENGFYELDINTLAVKDLSSVFHKNKLFQMHSSALHLSDSTVLLCGNRNKVVFNTKTFETKEFLYNEENKSQSGIAYKDAIGNIWIGNLNGLYKISNATKHFKSIGAREIASGDAAQIFMGVLKKDNELFINSFSGTYQYNLQSKKSVKIFPYPLWTVKEIDNELYFTGHHKHILKYKNKHTNPFLANITDTAFGPMGKSNLILFLYQDKFKNYWFALNEGYGLYRYNNLTKKVTVFKKLHTNNKLYGSYQNNCVEDNDGGMWFYNTHNSKLSYIAPASDSITEVSLLKHRSGISAAHYYKHKIYYNMAGNGVGIYDIATKSNTSLTKADGLPSLQASDIFVVNDKLVYTSCAGMYIKDLNTNQYKVFTKNNGLPGDNFNNFHYYDSATGLIFLPEATNIIYFNLDSVFGLPNYTTRIIAENYLVNDSIYYDDRRNMSFRYFENNISYNYSIIDWHNADKVQLFYKLRGFHNNWQIAKNRNTISFNNLSPGEYTLQLYTINANGVKSEIISFPSITIRQAFYKMWWFIGLCALFFSTLLFFVIRYYYQVQLSKQKAVLEKQKALEQERNRIATDMHDDFGANLSRIKFLSEKIKIQDSDNIVTELNRISAYSDDMAEKMNEIVWSLNSKYDTLDDLISYTRVFASETLSLFNTNLQFKQVDISDVALTSELRRNVFLCIKEAIHNITKHAQASSVLIKFSLRQHQLTVLVKDDGKGFDEMNIRQFANGLANMKKRMLDSNGELFIESKNGTSLTFTIRIAD